MTLLLILIPALWLATATFVVLLCRCAAAADRTMLAAGPAAAERSCATVRRRRHPATRTRGADALRARDARSRGARCAAGS